MSDARLRAVIDRLVEDAVRRILPGVMNEVLLKAIATSGIVNESVRRPAPKPRTGSTGMGLGKRAVPKDLHTRLNEDRRLADLLDHSAGSEFYGIEEEEHGAETIAEQREASIPRNLSPMLQSLAADVQVPPGFSDYGEHGDATPTPVINEIRDIEAAAKSIDIDFNRIASKISRITPVKKMTQEELERKAIFEERRLKALREKLDAQ